MLKPPTLPKVFGLSGVPRVSDGAAQAPSGGESPLVLAAATGNAECVRNLLEAGASIDQRDDGGRTALFRAGSAEVARVLIDAGVDLRATDACGRDALDEFLEVGPGGGHGRFEVAAELVRAGMEIGEVVNWPHTRIARAARSHDADAVGFLLSLGASVASPPLAPTALHCICWQGEHPNPEGTSACERIIRALVAAGIPVESIDERGRAAMHYAAEGDWGNPTAVRTLLILGARADPIDAGGWTPLMLAAARGEAECVRLLLEAGADPARADPDGSCALDHARVHQAMCASLNSTESPAGPTGEAADSASLWEEALHAAEACVKLLSRDP